MDMHKIGIIAAMEREVAGLVRPWSKVMLERGGHKWKAFQKDGALVVCAGIGAGPAGRAAEAVASKGVDVLISAGYAGALVKGMRAGGPLTPEAVVDAETGARFTTLFGGGVLVSSNRVLREEEKSELAHKYDAQGVDMEAATVAAVAERHGCGFLAVKAISDTLEFRVPPLEKFIDGDGVFHEDRFIAYTALRPVWWWSVAQLALNSRKASRTICGVLDAILQIDDLRKVKAGAGRVRRV